jgi:hypothetical protein
MNPNSQALAQALEAQANAPLHADGAPIEPTTAEVPVATASAFDAGPRPLPPPSELEHADHQVLAARARRGTSGLWR